MLESVSWLWLASVAIALGVVLNQHKVLGIGQGDWILLLCLLGVVSRLWRNCSILALFIRSQRQIQAVQIVQEVYIGLTDRSLALLFNGRKWYSLTRGLEYRFFVLITRFFGLYQWLEVTCNTLDSLAKVLTDCHRRLSFPDGSFFIK